MPPKHGHVRRDSEWDLLTRIPIHVYPESAGCWSASYYAPFPCATALVRRRRLHPQGPILLWFSPQGIIQAAALLISQRRPCGG